MDLPDFCGERLAYFTGLSLEGQFDSGEDLKLCALTADSRDVLTPVELERFS